MPKGLIFFCCACAILLFTIINLCIGPIISKKITYDNQMQTDNWGTLNCAQISDTIDNLKKAGAKDDDLKYSQKWSLKACRRKKAMYNMEYTSFIFNIAIGFVCGLLGLLHLFEVLQKEFALKTGLIGTGCGIIGFVLTLVYIIYNGLVYTHYYDRDIYKRDGNGAFAELKGDKYECFYFDKTGNTHALIAKYSDLSKKQYNYNKDLYNSFMYSEEVIDCKYEPRSCISEYIDKSIAPKKRNGDNCKYLYVNQSPDTTIANRDKSQRFLTALILSLFVCLANIGLALFGFLLYRKPDEF